MLQKGLEHPQMLVSLGFWTQDQCTHRENCVYFLFPGTWRFFCGPPTVMASLLPYFSLSQIPWEAKILNKNPKVFINLRIFILIYWVLTCHLNFTIVSQGTNAKPLVQRRTVICPRWLDVEWWNSYLYLSSLTGAKPQTPCRMTRNNKPSLTRNH
jgi:hypothetical protein